jgi:hypothetical protein
MMVIAARVWIAVVQTNPRTTTHRNPFRLIFLSFPQNRRPFAHAGTAPPSDRHTESTLQV